MSTASAPVEGGAPVAGSTPAPVASVLPATPTPRTPAAPAAAATTQPGAAPAQGQPAASEAPALPDYEHEFLKTAEGGKYRTLADYDKASTEKGTALRKALNQIRTMETKLPLLKGPPIDAETGLPGPYEFTPSERLAAKGYQIDQSDPVMEAATAWGHKWSIPQEAMQELLASAYEPMFEADMDAHLETERKGIIEFFGSAEAATQGLDNIAYKLMDALGGEEAYPEIRKAVGNKDTAIMLHKLIAYMDNVTLPTGGSSPTTRDTQADILAMRAEDPGLIKPGNRERNDRFVKEEAARRDAAGPQGKQTTMMSAR